VGVVEEKIPVIT